MPLTSAEAAFHELAGAFAARDPLPAGGAAGLTALAMGVGLGLKVLQISSAGAAEHAAPILDRLAELRTRLAPGFATDCEAFSELLNALRLPRDNPQRARVVDEAWRRATAVPVEATLQAREAEALLVACANTVKKTVRADLEAALDLVRCASTIAERNARDNATRLPGPIAAAILAPLDRSPPE